jgi:hypothetical protein
MPFALITLVLPDGQTVQVRLYETLQTTGRYPWRYRIGVPVGNGGELASYVIDRHVPIQ